ncbi:hypothetical protein IMZ48_41090 [Candidatus Bathyarchaeota archaeon]|nr:hypothetical protein [Candidatus Bathyarchaeota archaeon]
MGLLDKKPKSKVFKSVAPPKLRVEKVLKPAARQKLTPKPPSRATSSSHSSSPQPPSRPADDRKRKTPARAPRRISPVTRVDFGKESESENDDDWQESLESRKRRKRGRLEDGRYVDPNRKLKHPRALEEAVEGEVIHAAAVASVELKCEPVLGAKEDEVEVELRYPSMQKPER